MMNAVTIESDGDTKEAFDKLNDIFKGLPSNHIGIYNTKTKRVIDLGLADETMSVGNGSGKESKVVMSEDQFGDEFGGVSHNIKYRSIIDMINAEPGINQGLNIRSELSIGYGYRFKMVDVPMEISPSPVFPEISEGYWKLWARKVNYDHVLRQEIHSMMATGNVWVEKIYDKKGMADGGWGVQGLKVLSPDTMHNVVDDHGNILYFIQSMVDTTRTLGGITISYRDVDKFIKKMEDIRRSKGDDYSGDDLGGIVMLPRHKIVYYNYNAYYDDTVYGYGLGVPLISYAKSKIGIQKRVLRMIENSASSLMVFKYGTETNMVSGDGAKSIFREVVKRPDLKFILLPWYFDVEEKELGKNLPNAEPYLRYFEEQETNGIGLPPVLTGRGGSGEGSVIQLEIMSRQLMFIQKVVSNHHSTQLYPDCIIGDPLRHGSRMDVQDCDSVLEDIKNGNEPPVVFYPNLSPSFLSRIPQLVWNTMESVADRRLRHQVYAREGILTPREIREEMGYDGEVNDEDLSAPIRYQKPQNVMKESHNGSDGNGGVNSVNGDSKDPKDPKDSKDSKNSKSSKDSKGLKYSKGSKDFKDYKNTFMNISHKK